MEDWLKAALKYIPLWLGFQMRQTRQPGCAIAVAHKGRVVLNRAFGHADAINDQALTPKHRFRAASHSKSFAAAGIMKLRETNRVRLDDPVGNHVTGLFRDVAATTIAQLLSHSSGLIRDGTDAGQWQDHRPFLDEGELRAALSLPPVLEASMQFKYSNHGYGLIGLVIEAVTGERYKDWIEREIITASKLKHTQADGPPSADVPFAGGHSSRLPLGQRVLVPADNPTHALAPATGVISTASDLARFFASLDPDADQSVLSRSSRREMIRRQWHDAQSTLESYYGLGTMIGKIGDWEWVGHSGGFQGCVSRTVMLPGRDLSVSVLTNAIDGGATPWSEGAVQILRSFSTRGTATAETADWTGRWWSLWGAIDLVPASDHVVVATPSFTNPFSGASEIKVAGGDGGWINLAGGFGSHGEGAHLVRDGKGRVREVWIAGTKFQSEARAKAELKRQYQA